MSCASWSRYDWVERPGEAGREVGMGLTREGEGGEAEGEGDRLKSSAGEGDLTR